MSGGGRYFLFLLVFNCLEGKNPPFSRLSQGEGAAENHLIKRNRKQRSVLFEFILIFQKTVSLGLMRDSWDAEKGQEENSKKISLEAQGRRECCSGYEWCSQFRGATTCIQQSRRYGFISQAYSMKSFLFSFPFPFFFSHFRSL